MGIPLHAELKKEPKIEVLREAHKYFKTLSILEYFMAKELECISASNKRDEEIYHERIIKLQRKLLEIKQNKTSDSLESVLDRIIHKRYKDIRYINVDDLIPELVIREGKRSLLDIMGDINETIRRVNENYIGLKQAQFLWEEEKIAALEYAKKNIHTCFLLKKAVDSLENSSLSSESISRIQRVVEANKDSVYADGIVGHLCIYLSKLLDYNVRPKEISKCYIPELKPPCDTVPENDEWDKRNNSEAVMYLRKLIRKMKKENE